MTFQDLLTQPRQFTFLQAMRILRRTVNADAGADDRLDFEKRIRVRPRLSLGFATTDLDSIETYEDAEEQTRYRITANMLGLYGADAPLPTFYTEDLFEEAREDESASRDFIDIINTSLYHLLFHCFTKYRLPLRIGDEPDALVLEILYALVGLGEPTMRKTLRHPELLLRYTGLLSQYPRSALGLRTLLADAINEPTLDVTPCRPRYAEIPADQICRLGAQGSTLGTDTYVGQFVYERMGKMEIQVGPVDADRFHALLPGREEHEQAAFLTRFYLTEPLEMDLEVVLADGEAECACLGGARWGNLGWNTWVFSGTLEGACRARFRV